MDGFTHLYQPKSIKRISSKSGKKGKVVRFVKLIMLHKRPWLTSLYHIGHSASLCSGVKGIFCAVISVH